MADAGIADRLRAEGLTVKEVPGWKTRGRDFAGVSGPFNPKGSVNHHTAGARDRPGGRTPSLGICINGRSDLPGPLCNVYLGFDNVVYVIAAGVANHAGIPDGGSCRGMTGNSTAYGLEIEHPGTFPLAAGRVAVAAKIHAALLLGKGLPASQVVQHWEWAPSRKIDLATNMHPGTSLTADGFRQMIAEHLAPPQYEWYIAAGGTVLLKAGSPAELAKKIAAKPAPVRAAILATAHERGTFGRRKVA